MTLAINYIKINKINTLYIKLSSPPLPSLPLGEGREGKGNKQENQFYIKTLFYS
jgi:hypothetical protein